MMRPILLLRALAAMLFLAVMAGCAHAPATMYQWEGYQHHVYDYMRHDKGDPGEQLRAMQLLSAKSLSNGSKLPPGFHAHIAMLEIQLGQFDAAKAQLEAEKVTFPESTHYMDFLLKQMSEKKS